MTRESELVIELVRLAVKGGKPPRIPSDTDWQKIISIAHQQGVSAIMSDGLTKIIEQNADDGVMTPEFARARRSMFGYVMGEETRFGKLTRALADLVAFNNENGIRTLLIKGPGLSLNYPIPQHRNSSDLDIYEFGEHEKADRLLAENLGVKIDSSHEHHTTYSFGGVNVENHYDIVNRYAHKDGAEADDHFKKLLAEGNSEIEFSGQKILVPSAQFNSEFLLRHAAQHFAGERLMLRQILDWVTLADMHCDEIDWNATRKFAAEHGMADFMSVMISICTDYLGVEKEKFGSDLAKDNFLAKNKDLVRRVINDVMESEFRETKPKSGFIMIMAFKLRRWKANIWKHRLVYMESLPMMFLTLAWSHLRRPGSITE